MAEAHTWPMDLLRGMLVREMASPPPHQSAPTARVASSGMPVMLLHRQTAQAGSSTLIMFFQLWTAVAVSGLRLKERAGAPVLSCPTVRLLVHLPPSISGPGPSQI